MKKVLVIFLMFLIFNLPEKAVSQSLNPNKFLTKTFEEVLRTDQDILLYKKEELIQLALLQSRDTISTVTLCLRKFTYQESSGFYEPSDSKCAIDTMDYYFLKDSLYNSGYLPPVYYNKPVKSKSKKKLLQSYSFSRQSSIQLYEENERYFVSVKKQKETSCSGIVYEEGSLPMQVFLEFLDLGSGTFLVNVNSHYGDGNSYVVSYFFSIFK